ncbi:MAG: shikimate kinase [Lachnospiraceae bacterium]|jgi:shikimate kinase|nr:shikimate kinase [Lachnospiraceae bacterium]
MSNATNNIILIGMPGAGKSTVGAALARKKGFGFIDSDDLIEKNCGKKLNEIIFESGQDGFLEIENFINATMEAKNKVIATGGSAVYGKEAMEHFAKIGDIVYLKLSFKQIAARLGDLERRGVALKAGQTLEDIYAKREPLYEKYAQITIDCERKDVKTIVAEIEKKIQ